MYGYSPEVVRFSYQSALDYYAAMGIELSQADREQLAADAIDHFIGLGLIENKLRETGQASSRRSRRKACVPMPKTCMRAYGRACIRN